MKKIGFGIALILFGILLSIHAGILNFFALSVVGGAFGVAGLVLALMGCREK